ncbi:hypothetical protein JHK85_007224 [Glycine max]|nr:hypothetical protein JHK85_007224 [Glycine max]
MDPPPQKINLISCEPMVHISNIKLIRTDTTLDLSQKAKKGAARTQVPSTTNYDVGSATWADLRTTPLQRCGAGMGRLIQTTATYDAHL